MSNINPNIIDGTFPIAGQDNSSQGFRDNFTNIRNNFSYAQSELNDLQSKAITTSALNGAAGTNNNMNYNVLQNAQLFSPSYTYLNLGSPTAGALSIDYSRSSVQQFATIGSYTLSFANLPSTGQMASLILAITISSTSHTITLPSSVVGLTEIAGANSTTRTIAFDQTGTYYFQFTTPDAGTTITINDLSRNYATFRDPNFYWNDNIVSTLFAGFGSNSSVLSYAVASDAGRSTIVADGQYSSVSIGNLALANLTYSTLDTGPLSGYNITSARGNIQTGTFTPVQGGDLLGYHNAVTFTGNANTGNIFQQVSTIAFYATGSNVTYGLGGNIVFATGKDGDVAATHTVYQAVGIENDQSVKFYGNVVYSGGVVDQGYQFVVPTTGFWANVTPGKSRIIFNPAGTLASGNITLPNAAVDGTIISVHSSATITAFGANSLQSGTVVKPNTAITLAAGTAVDYFYHATENTWYKIR
jgi:hypothetical protein